VRNSHRTILEANRKRRAQRGYAPTPEEWVNSQPERWRLICKVFAVNVNTCGGIVSKPLQDIVKNANDRGYKIGLTTVRKFLPGLEHYGVVRQEQNWYPNSDAGAPRRAPSTWLLGLRKRMPDMILPPDDAQQLTSGRLLVPILHRGSDLGRDSSAEDRRSFETKG
jgi:hypothetical protein